MKKLLLGAGIATILTGAALIASAVVESDVLCIGELCCGEECECGETTVNSEV